MDFEMKKIAILFSVALMTACSSSSSASLPVKVIDAKAAESCKLIDVVSGSEIFSLTVDKNVALARQNAANEAIKLGANAVVITGTDEINTTSPYSQMSVGVSISDDYGYTAAAECIIGCYD